MRARLLTAAALGAGLQVALIVTGFAQPLLITVNALAVVVATAALWTLGRRAVRARGRERLAWGIVAVAMLLWLPATELNLRVALTGVSEEPGPHLLLGTGGAGLVLLCLLVGPGTSPARQDRLRLTLDSAMAAAALFVPAWAFLLRPASEQLGRSVTTMISVVVCTQIAALAFALMLLSRHRGTNAFTLLAAASAVSGAASVTYCALIVHDRTSGLAAVAALSTLAAFMLIAMTWYPMPGTAPRTGAATGLSATLPYLPVLGAFTVMVALRRYGGFDNVVFAAMCVVFGLVLLRQAVALHSITLLLAEVEEKRAELQHQTTHDQLTGLTNRSYLYERAAGWGRAPVSLLLLDLDGFKEINDRFGHAAGDDVMVEVAGVLTALVPPHHTVARLGGDEFAVILEPSPPPAEAAAFGERLIAAITAKGRVGASLGLAYEPTGRTTLGMLLSDADAALHKAKAAGKGRVALNPRALP
ncbi:diguanylate cyclase (GGDEF)-like protein [Catenuloplanes nepalensis]|uniref:Diguanylate cyclase (GGDEF)-like protein n=1 Tax=Catenuloplanes nepalensis TaxID=587533 RepID=A0ABT9MS05_9ACTN|nr:GGDEF domain-containing protein [Catenuloplanes nepalensis]MDP9794043.1 diguanylate cyclase (GGDEF)-like protein [Catenuloplanes nepalensis]